MCNLLPEILGFEGWGGLFSSTAFHDIFHLEHGIVNKTGMYFVSFWTKKKKGLSEFQTFHPLLDSSKIKSIIIEGGKSNHYTVCRGKLSRVLYTCPTSSLAHGGAVARKTGIKRWLVSLIVGMGEGIRTHKMGMHGDKNIPNKLQPLGARSSVRAEMARLECIHFPECSSLRMLPWPSKAHGKLQACSHHNRTCSL